MPIIITAKKNGFRRCGVAHPAAPTEYKDGRFTEDELATLQAEPMLVVVEAPADSDAKKAAKPKAEAKPKDADKADAKKDK